MRHSLSFPAVTSSALCPVALLLSNGEMFDIKMVPAVLKGGEPEPFVLRGWGLTWPGVS